MYELLKRIFHKTPRTHPDASSARMPKIIGGSQRVVDDGKGLTIDELAGNVATSDDRISIAHVEIKGPTSEPWVTTIITLICHVLLCASRPCGPHVLTAVHTP